MTRVALLGNFGSENLGNEASLQAVASVLRRADANVQLSCICPHPNLAAGRHGMPATPLRPQRWARSDIARQSLRVPRAIGDLIRAIRVVRAVDAIVVPGTGVLDDYGEVPTGMPYDLLIWSLGARLSHRPFHFVAVGAGPIRNGASRKLLQLAARLASSRSYRDRDSRDFMGSIGLDVSGDTIVPDVVFALPIGPAGRPARERPLVGIGLMDYDGWTLDNAAGPTIQAQYLNRLASVVAQLVAEGFDAELVFGETSDDAVAVPFLELLPDEIRHRVQPTVTPASLMELGEQIGRYDVAVVSRFHSALVAMMTGVPTVSLGYAPKNKALLTAFGLAPYCHEIESFEAASVAADVRELQAQRPARASAMLDARNAFARDVTHELDGLMERLGK